MTPDRRRPGACVEAWRFHWWLAVLMGVLLSVISLFTWMTVRRIRTERAAQP